VTGLEARGTAVGVDGDGASFGVPTADEADAALLVAREGGVGRVPVAPAVVVRPFRAGVLPPGGAELLPYESFETVVHRYSAVGTPRL